MAVTISNIIIGPCSSFSIGATNVGGTSGGVSIEKKRTFVDLQVDQVYGIAKKAIKEDVYTVKTQLPEATLQNLQLAWGATSAPTVTGAAPATTTTLNLGIDTTVAENVLTFVGPAPVGTNKTRTFTLNRAVAMVTGAVEISKDKETLITVEFQCLPDTSKAAGQEYGTIVDN